MPEQVTDLRERDAALDETRRVLVTQVMPVEISDLGVRKRVLKPLSRALYPLLFRNCRKQGLHSQSVKSVTMSAPRPE